MAVYGSQLGTIGSDEVRPAACAGSGRGASAAICALFPLIAGPRPVHRIVAVICLIIAVVGVTSLLRMPVDMFPSMNIPVVACATFYSGMPPEQIETDITSRFERFFTLGAGIDHIESRSLPGVSLIKVYFQPGTDADSAVTTISNLAMADLRKLPACA